jgi:hypothetical protein
MRIRQLTDTSQPYVDRLPAIGLSFSVYISSIRGCSVKLDRVSSSCLVFSTTHFLILMAVLRFHFTNTLRFLTLAESTLVRITRTHALCATRVQSSARRANTFSGLSAHSFSSPLALLRSMFGEKGNFRFFKHLEMTARQDP